MVDETKELKCYLCDCKEIVNIIQANKDYSLALKRAYAKSYIDYRNKKALATKIIVRQWMTRDEIEKRIGREPEEDNCG